MSPEPQRSASRMGGLVAPAGAKVITRRQFLAAAGAGGALLLLAGSPVASAATRSIWKASGRDSVVIQWNDAFLEAVRASRLGPPMVARALAVAHTCIYDAWAAYDPSAVGTEAQAIGESLAGARELARVGPVETHAEDLADVLANDLHEQPVGLAQEEGRRLERRQPILGADLLQ